MAKRTRAAKGHYVGCTIKQLPPEKRDAGAREAVQINPVNAPMRTFLPELLGAIVTAAPHGTMLTSSYWGAGGVKLTVGFFDRAATAQFRARILGHMNAWGEFSNVEFRDVGDVSKAQVRISRAKGGYWSYLGTDILQIPKNQQTMNLEGFTMSTPESEFVRVVRHEVGHTCGFPHEHFRADIVARLDPEKTIAYFSATQGWSRQEVIQQVLTPLDPASIVATPAGDTLSIMCYQLPGSITRDGNPIAGGADFDQTDREFAAKMYPKSVGPPVVTPPVVIGGGVYTLTAFDDAGKELYRFGRLAK